jgi:hypothetical protein
MRKGVDIARRAASAVTHVIGVDEVGLIAALLLIAVGFWDLWRPGAFLVPGAVLLWIWLPVRKPFVHRPTQASMRRK